MHVVLIPPVERPATVGARVEERVGKVQALHVVLSVVLLLELLAAELAGVAVRQALCELFQEGLVLRNAWEQRGAADEKIADEKK